MRRPAAAFVLLILICAASPAQVNREDLLDPLPIRDQFLLSNGFFFFEPESARVLAENESVIAMSAADSNTFAKSAWISRSEFGNRGRRAALDELANSRFHLGGPVFLVDGETHRLEIAMHRGLGRNLELGVTIPISTIGGGWADRLIEGVHRTLSIGNANREAFRRNSETVYLQTATTQYVRERSVGYALGDVAISGKYELKSLEDRGISMSVMGALELPTGDPQTLDGSGSLDGGLQLVASRDFSRTRFHASLGILRLGSNGQLGTKPQVLVTDTFGLSHLLSDRTSAEVQMTISESPFRDIGIAEFTRRSYQLSIGMQRRIGRSLIAYAALIENVLSFENSADAGVAWGVTFRPPG
ncbi:MAG TPA: DUF3187 family protein [Thermoanaerobaculia bacterium]|nr:DUF3187 family protein [Thermoanaerobaculia bacterium]